MAPSPNSTPIFSGEFRHALDPKNRVTIPSRWRSSEADEFHLVASPSGQFLRVMPPSQFRAVGEKLEANTSITLKQRLEFKRQFYSQSLSVVTDKQGRMLVPESLGKKVGLQGEVVLVGMYETFELWSPEAWAAAKHSEEATFAQVAELIGL